MNMPLLLGQTHFDYWGDFMKSKIIKLVSIIVVLGMLIYPISFLKHAFTNYSSLKVLVGTEYDVSITAAWVVGSLIYLVLSLQNLSF